MVSFTKSYLSQIFSKVLDLLSILLSSFLSINIWYPSFYEKVDNHKTFVEHLPLLLNIIICWFLSSYWIGFYKKNLLSYGRSSVVSILTLFLSSTSTYFISIYAFSRGVLLLTIIFHALISAFWRVIIHLLYRYGKVNIYYDSPLFTRRAAILGIDSESQRIAKLLKNTVESDFNLMGYIGKSHKTTDVVCLGHEEDIKGIIHVNKINELIIPEKKYQLKN